MRNLTRIHKLISLGIPVEYTEKEKDLMDYLEHKISKIWKHKKEITYLIEFTNSHLKVDSITYYKNLKRLHVNNTVFNKILREGEFKRKRFPNEDSYIITDTEIIKFFEYLLDKYHNFDSKNHKIFEIVKF